MPEQVARRPLARERKKQEQQEQPREERGEAKSEPRKSPWKRLLTRKVLAILLGASLFTQTVGLFAYLARAASEAEEGVEVDLGQYDFDCRAAPPGGVSAGRFWLHIALLEEVDDTARQQLRQSKFRVRQGVEQLLRDTVSEDFDDPDLGDLKLRIQEQINGTLGQRAIAEVIITGLEREYRPQRRITAGAEPGPSQDRFLDSPANPLEPGNRAATGRASQGGASPPP